MPAVWEQRYSRAIARLLGLRESTQQEVLPDLMPVISVADPSAADQIWARGELRVTAGFAVTGVAAQSSLIEIVNPAGSNCICIAEHIHISSAGDSQIHIAGSGASGALGGAVATLAPTDARGVLSRACTFNAGTAVVAGSYAARFQVIASTPQQWELFNVIPPGQLLRIWSVIPNLAFTGTVRWRERQVQATEIGR